MCLSAHGGFTGRRIRLKEFLLKAQGSRLKGKMIWPIAFSFQL
jgi:hypothetical protein